MQVVCLPQIFDISQRHGAGLFPTLLQLPESIEGVVERFVAVDQLFELIDDFQFDLIVVFLLFFEFGDEVVAL